MQIGHLRYLRGGLTVRFVVFWEEGGSTTLLTYVTHYGYALRLRLRLRVT